ncbi:MAG: hypothetical protein JWQ63_4401 [Mucilaginibacter sp.]|jgi:hypothetical protein|nr:hypothetical protein [Mucilaginibacter sp.]
MSPKFRLLYLFLGFAGLFCLVYYVVTSFPDVNPINVLLITIPDIIFFSLAYKTYPVENDLK